MARSRAAAWHKLASSGPGETAEAYHLVIAGKRTGQHHEETSPFWHKILLFVISMSINPRRNEVTQFSNKIMNKVSLKSSRWHAVRRNTISIQYSKMINVHNPKILIPTYWKDWRDCVPLTHSCVSVLWQVSGYQILTFQRNKEKHALVAQSRLAHENTNTSHRGRLLPSTGHARWMSGQKMILCQKKLRSWCNVDVILTHSWYILIYLDISWYILIYTWFVISCSFYIYIFL